MNMWSAREIAVGALIAIALLTISFAAPGTASAVAYTSAGSGDWSNSATWAPNGVPNGADTVVIGAGHTITVTSAQATLGVTVNGTGVLTVTGSTLAVGATGITVSASGTVTNGGAITSAGNVVVTTPGVVTNNGTLTITGTLTGNGSVVQSVSSTLNLENAAAPTITTLNATTSTPNTVAYTGAGQAIGVYAYSNLTLSGSGAKTGNPTSVSGALTLAGTATYSLPTLTIGGDLNVQGGTLTVPGITLTVNGNTSISGGLLTITNATGTKTLNGDLTISGGTWQNNTVAEPVAIAGNVTYLSGTFTGGTGVYTMSGTDKQVTGPISTPALTVTGAGLTLTGTNAIGALTVTSPGTVTNTGTLTISASLGVAAALAGTGALTNGASATLDLETGAMATLIADDNTTNTVRYVLAGAQGVKGVTYNHLILAGTGAKTGAAAISVQGTFTLSDPATFTTGAFAHTFRGNVVIDTTAVTPITATGSTLNFETPSPQATTSIGGSGGTTLTLVTVNFNNLGGVTTSRNIKATTATVGGAATFTNGGTFTATTLTVSGGGTFVNNATHISTTVNVNGTFTNGTLGTSTVSGVLTVNTPATFANNGVLNSTGTLAGFGQLVAGTNSTLNLNNATAPTITTLNFTTNMPNAVVYGLGGV